MKPDFFPVNRLNRYTIGHIVVGKEKLTQDITCADQHATASYSIYFTVIPVHVLIETNNNFLFYSKKM